MDWDPRATQSLFKEETWVTGVEETWVTGFKLAGGPVPQTPGDFSHEAEFEVRSGRQEKAARCFELSPDQALGLLPSRALSSLSG